MLSFSEAIFKTILIIAAGIILSFQFFMVCGAQSHDVGIVMVDKLNLRRKPGVKKPPLISIPKDTRVRILEHHRKWLKISYQDQVGYVRNLKRYIRVVSVDKEKQIVKVDHNSKVERYENEADRINLKIEKGMAEVRRFSQEEISIVNSLNDIDLALDKARKNARALKIELADLKKEIKKTRAESQNLQKQIETSEDYASQRLVALYKLNWLGRIYILASAKSMYDLFQRKKAMERILAYDESIWKNLLDNKNRMQQLLNRMDTQKSEILSVQEDLKKQIATMSLERTKRSNLLDEIQKKKSLELAALESLKEAASNLNHTIKFLNYKSIFMGPKKNISPKSFSSLKGLLNMPVKGKIIKFFGPHKNNKFNVVNFQSGIDIKADMGEPIRAVYEGRIIYASWFKGYGNMIIIDHGSNYYTVYAHAQDLFASKGDSVEMGEVVATVGDSGSMIGPSLHFEVRYHGKPVDPLKWIKKG